MLTGGRGALGSAENEIRDSGDFGKAEGFSAILAWLLKWEATSMATSL